MTLSNNQLAAVIAIAIFCVPVAVIAIIYRCCPEVALTFLVDYPLLIVITTALTIVLGIRAHLILRAIALRETTRRFYRTLRTIFLITTSIGVYIGIIVVRLYAMLYF